ncbi:hypothetical protein [Marinigracilibium pacificum]|uniref:Auto-transporter adhesin head GIN domain-containing protein n=1 Tax=Marinigracilibium pacificum TaxID=2729599 RepID=A0A848IYI6_9BACT|nr:hypothetical protein [Marinigracilibium pacificum]NMM48228.1 hypothetical protein [Marinigracilibium pacificum]
MKSKLIVFFAALFVSFHTISASVIIRYTNKDTQAYNMKVNIGGSDTKVKFSGRGTGSVTVQGMETECIIKTPCGEVKVKSGDIVSIQNGCIVVY